MNRILFVTNNMGLGGAEKKIVDLANGLCENGFEIAILAFDAKDEKGIRIKDLSPRIQIITLATRCNLPIVSLCRRFYETVKAIRRWNPDVVYSNLWNANLFAAVAGKLSGTGVVLEVSNSEAIEIERKKSRTLTRFYRKSVYRLADAITAVSKGAACEAKDIYNLPHVETIYNGIDIEDVTARSNIPGDTVPHAYFRDEPPVVVATGRLQKQKGYRHLLEAFRIVSEATEARLIIIGEGNLKDELRRTVKSLGMEDRVAMVGAVEPYPFMRHGDIFAHSALHEGFGIVLVEAMSLGMPVVSTDCNYGPGEIIENGKNGLLVPVGDPRKMASRIIRLIGDKDLRSSLGEKAKERARRFNSDAMVSGYEEIFRDLKRQKPLGNERSPNA